ncbi:MAG TPA: EAL domain-containing protein [Steroidobacteraceae bacterium]|nr:EAL domain-containing protein [Steroidobacteraceae bacterium]
MDLAAQSALDDTMRMVAVQAQATLRIRVWLSRLIEPQILFPALTLLILAGILGVTFNLIKVERTSARTAASAASLELVNTYQAQVVRALREIDRTLKTVKYVYETRGAGATLSELKARSLLPPDLIFVVQVLNSDGVVVASTRPVPFPTAADQGYLSALRSSETLWVGKPTKNPAAEDWTLQFARRLDAPGGEFAGAVLLAVDASYFVSGYDTGKLGKHGILGLLGTDGVFRARRTGDTLTAGDAVNYATAVPGADQEDPTVSLSDNSWDGIRRYTGAQQLYEFPLAVIVGLSEEEQLAAAARNARVYLWRAVIGSGLLMLVTALLGRLSWQLARSRARESEAKVQHAQRVEYLAYHDGLTALPNRSLFNKLLSQAIRHARRHGHQLAVAFIDLDRFKQINDTLGHEAGDELLKEVANRLKGCLRESDTVARLGGDEFVVLLTDLQEEKYAATVAQKIIASIAKPFLLLGQDFRVTASIGVSTYPQDGEDEQTLTKNADIAMYQAKEDGKNNFQFYSEKLNANSLERLTLESALRHALDRHEFQLHYQAKRDMATGQITGMEALLRWQHPDLGIVAPMQFIPVAEETGLIVPIGKWVLRTACEQNVAWQRQGLPRLNIAVNLTARQFSDEHLLRDIAATLKETGMEASLLEVEIHEALLIRDIDKTLQILTALKNMGVKIAIDDFGTGYSSLSTLQRFPLDTIKIDRSFIRDLPARGDHSNLTEAIIAMGKTLSVTVVAQGVETKEQADLLRERSCDEFQGFYFNKPLSAQQFTELLQTQTQAVVS